MSVRNAAILLGVFKASAVFSHSADESQPYVLPPSIETRLGTAIAPEDLAVVQGVVSRYNLWDPGQTIQICFFDGSQEVRKFFIETADLWDVLSSTSFDFGNTPNFRDCDSSDNNHIRISFNNGSGNWSYIGTDSISIPQSQPSLSVDIGELFNFIDKRQLAATILHELGHALALHHEHQSPSANCEAEFNWEVIYQELGGSPNNWSREKVDHNLRALISSPRFATTEYDPASIMHYYFPPYWFLNQSESACYTVENMSISRLDEASIEYMYPDVPQRQTQYFKEMDNLSARILSELNLNDEQLNVIMDEIENVSNRIETRSYTAEDLSVTLENVTTYGQCSNVIGSVTGDITLDCR